MQVRFITVRPKSTLGAIAAGTAIVVIGTALVIVGTTILLGLAAVGATVGLATLAYRRITGRRGSAIDSAVMTSALGDPPSHARLGLDPRMEVQPPSGDGGSVTGERQSIPEE